MGYNKTDYNKTATIKEEEVFMKNNLLKVLVVIGAAWVIFVACNEGAAESIATAELLSPEKLFTICGSQKATP